MSDITLHRKDGVDSFHLDGRLMVPACHDCEEPGKCIVMGCGHAAVAKMEKRRCPDTFADIGCCQEAGHSGPHGNFADGGARVTWEWPGYGRR